MAESNHQERVALIRAQIVDDFDSGLWDRLQFMVEIEQVRASDLAAIEAYIAELRHRYEQTP